MASARSTWGIDVGNRALKAIKLVRDGEGVRIADLDVIEHEQVLSTAGDNRDALIQSSLANFVARHSTKGSVVSIGVAGNAAFARFVPLPPVEAKKIPEIVRFEAIQQIPFPLDDVEWSYQLFQQADSPEVGVGIFAMRKELVSQHINYFTDLDMNVQVVQMNPLAVYNALQYDGHLNETTMVLDLGAENTDLIISDGESVWLRSIPIGGNNFTESLVKAFKLNFAKAEELKRTAATSKYARQIFQAMRPVFADLVSEVQRSIGFYTSTHRDSRVKKIIALGATFRLQGLQKYLQQNLQLEVERLDRFSAPPPDDGRVAAVLNENLISMVSAYGLALQGMDHGKITSSLLPEAIRRAKIWREKTKWFALAASLFVIGTGLAYGSVTWQRWQMEDNTQHAQQVDQIVAKAVQASRSWDDIANAGTGDKNRINNLNGMIADHDLWSQIVSTIDHALPEPQDALKAGLAAKNKELIIQIPRAQRRQILLDSLASQYYPDMSAAPAEPAAAARSAPTLVSVVPIVGDPGGDAGAYAGPSYSAGPSGQPNYSTPMPPGMGQPPSGMPQPPNAPPGQSPPPVAGLPGFVITLRCSTPNAMGATLITNTLQKELLDLTDKKAASEGKPFYITQVKITSRSTVGSTVGAPAGGPDAALPPELVDPITGESRANDTEYTVVVYVVIAPAASPANPPAAQSRADRSIGTYALEVP